MIAPLLFMLLRARSGPVALPGTPYRTFYAGSKIQVNWTNGDPEAYTKVYVGGSLAHTASPGATSWASAQFSLAYIEVSHFRDDIETAKVPEA